MTPIKDTDYLAVSAWLHAMETRLLTPEKVERLLEAASETEARKLLTECGYAEALTLEEALREHRETLYKELAAAVPDPRLIELFCCQAVGMMPLSCKANGSRSICSR